LLSLFSTQKLLRHPRRTNSMLLQRIEWCSLRVLGESRKYMHRESETLHQIHSEIRHGVIDSREIDLARLKQAELTTCNIFADLAQSCSMTQVTRIHESASQFGHRSNGSIAPTKASPSNRSAAWNSSYGVDNLGC